MGKTQSLYIINAKVENLLYSCIDEETGEFNEALFAEQSAALDLEKATLLESIAEQIKSLDADADAIKKRENELAERRKRKEGYADKLCAILATEVEKQPLQRFDRPTVSVFFRISESTNILDADKIPNEYKTEKTTYTPDKTRIKQAIKSGITVDGAEVVVNKNLQIK